MRTRSLTFMIAQLLSDEGRAHLKAALLLSVVAGAIRGIALVVLVPAATVMATGGDVWGLSFGGWCAVLAVCALLAFLVEYVMAIRNYHAALDLLASLHRIIGQKVSELPLGWFQSASAGILSRLVSREMMILGESVAHMTSPAVAHATTSAVLLIGVFLWNPLLGGGLALSIPLLWGAVKVARLCQQKENALVEPASHESARRLVEYARKQGALRSCNRSENYAPLSEAETQVSRASYRGLWWATLGQIVNGMATQFIVVSAISAIALLTVRGTFTPVEAVVAIGILLRFVYTLNDVGSLLMGLETRRPLLAMTRRVLDAPCLPEPPASAQIATGGEILLENVSFGYEADTPVIRDVSFRVAPGQMVAIVGPSGCGKTTLARLIARFYDADEGRVSVGGHDVRDYRIDDLMSQLSVVFQDVYLYDDTLEANIRVGREDASHEDVERAAALTGVTEIVNRLPHGWLARVGEGGRSLSGGERQRVSVARALLKEAPIVLFDEATSALDTENEANIVAAMEELRSRSTLVVIAHKLETIARADQILVLSREGRLVQVGTHEELLEREGEYRAFWSSRARAEGWTLREGCL